MRRLFLALLASATCLGAPDAVRCDPIDPGPAIAGLPTFDILALVRSSGFAPIGRPVRRAGAYVVLALDPYDRPVRLTIDARDGRVVAVRSASMAPAIAGYEVPPASFYGRRGYAHGPLAGRLDDRAGFEDAAGALPLPPRSIPSPRPGLPNVSRSAAVLPLPRPRPADAGIAHQPPELPKVQADTAMPPVTPLE